MADNAVDRLEAPPDSPANCQYGPWWKGVWTWVIPICCLGAGIGIGYGIAKGTLDQTKSEVVVPTTSPTTTSSTSSATTIATTTPSGDLPPPGYGEDADIMNFLSTMTADEKIGQMLLADVQLVLNSTDPTTVNRTALVELMTEVPFGSVFNSVTAAWGNPLMDVNQWQDAVKEFSSVARQLGVIWPLFGIDTVHGANYVAGAATFPHQLALGGSYNRTAAKVMGEIGGKDTRAAGIGWTFSPILDLATQPTWSRNFETWGESPHVSGEMTKELLNGYQGDNGSLIHENTRIAACMKHFVAYAASMNGQDRGPVGIGDATLMNIYMKSYELAMEVNPATIMSGFHCQNDDPASGSAKYLKKLLRDYLRFPNLMVTDYNTVAEMQTLHHMVPTTEEALEHMFSQTTTDVTMSAWDVKMHFNMLKASLAAERITIEDIDIAAYRMIELKKKLGWNLDPTSYPGDTGFDYYGDPVTIGQDSDFEAALDATRQSIVLVRNEGNALPIDASTLNQGGILVTGPSSDSATWQSGGWTCHWQGCTHNWETIRWETLMTHFGNATDYAGKFAYSPGLQADWPHDANKTAMIAEAVALVTDTGNGGPADYVIIGVGEAPYTERPGNIDDAMLPAEQIDLIRAIQDEAEIQGSKVVLVLFEGRPRVLPPDVVEKSDAILVGYWPGPLAGQAAGEIIEGKVNPSSTLSFGYPHSPNQGPHTHYHKYSHSSYIMYDQFHQSGGSDFCHTGCWGAPLWEFGFGLSYTTFEFTIVSPADGAVYSNSPDISVEVVVNVKNTGTEDGAWPVILFVSDVYRLATSPEYKLVQAFDRVFLNAGEDVDVPLTLTRKAFEFHTVADPFAPPIIEDGTFVLRTGIPRTMSPPDEFPPWTSEVNSTICIGSCH